MKANAQKNGQGPPDISIVGEINPDQIVYGVPHELPEEREILANGFTMTLGSSSAILAHNLALLGSKVSFSSRIGTDVLGDMCYRWLQEAAVNVSQVVRAAFRNQHRCDGDSSTWRIAPNLDLSWVQCSKWD